jgi:4-hydroxy-tetrahydrodipicolinate synthase
MTKKILTYPKFTGIFTALITPFKNNAIDYMALEKMIMLQIQANVAGLVVCGTTAETSTLSFREQTELIEFVVKIVKNKIKIIAGICSNNTFETIEMVKKIEILKVDALILVTPYYIRPMQEGLYQHYLTVSNATSLPIFLYSVPKRTGIDFTDNTVVRLAALDNIIGIKDCTSDFLRPLRLQQQISKEFYQLCGDDASILHYCAASGGMGCVSVASNIIPKEMVELFDCIQNTQIAKARALQQKLLPLYDAIFVETNPIGVKYAAYLLGYCSYEVRLPLVAPSPQSCELLKMTLKNLKLL